MNQSAPTQAEVPIPQHVSGCFCCCADNALLGFAGKIKAFTRTLQVSAFYLYNVFRPILFGWLGAVQVSGLGEDKTFWLAVIVAIMYGAMGFLSLVCYMRKLNARFNFWTAAVLAEASKERLLSRVIVIIYLLLFLGFGINDWYIYQNSTGSCDERASKFRLGVGIILVGLNVIQIWTYDGPFSEHLELTNPVFYKLCLPKWWQIPFLWSDSAEMITNLRALTYVVHTEKEYSVAELKDKIEYSDLSWDWVNNLQNEDWEILFQIVRGTEMAKLEKEIENFVKSRTQEFNIGSNEDLNQDQKNKILKGFIEKFLPDLKISEKELKRLEKLKAKKFKDEILEIWRTTKIPNVLFGLIAFRPLKPIKKGSN